MVLNFSAQNQVVTVAGQMQGHIVLSTNMDSEGSIDFSTVRLRGNEGILIEVDRL